MGNKRPIGKKAASAASKMLASFKMTGLAKPAAASALSWTAKRRGIGHFQHSLLAAPGWMPAVIQPTHGGRRSHSRPVPLSRALTSACLPQAPWQSVSALSHIGGPGRRLVTAGLS